jgi:hypothetical protein
VFGGSDVGGEGDGPERGGGGGADNVASVPFVLHIHIKNNYKNKNN